MSVLDWSVTAASNTSVGGISIAEGMNPSAVNNAIRGLMAEVAEWAADIVGGTTSGTVGGTADAITLTTAAGIAAYAANQRFLVPAGSDNTTTTPTLNVDGLGAKTIKLPGGTAVVAAQWDTGDPLLLVYDGTDMLLVAGGRTPISPTAAQIAALIAAATEETTAEPTTDMLLQRNTDGTLEKILHTNLKPREVIALAVGTETGAITTGTAKLTFRMPFAMTLTAVRASVTTAPTGATIIIDINEGGTTILSTKLSIDATEKTSTTAASAAVISDAALADDAQMTIDFDQVGSTVAGAGVKVYLIGYRT